MRWKRREFLAGGMATAATQFVAGSMKPLIQSGSFPLADADVIWCSSAVPVPLPPNVTPNSIASSSNRKDPSVPDVHCVFARTVSVQTIPSSASLHLFAYTRYRLYVNGVYAGRGPCRYQNQRPEYDTRDIKSLFRVGINTVVVLVHRDAPTGRIMFHEPGFVAALELDVKGVRQVIKTNISWLCMPELAFGPRDTSWSSIPENLDARKSIDWTLPDLSSSGWRPASVVTHRASASVVPRSTPLQTEEILAWDTGSPSLPFDLCADCDSVFRLPQIAQAFHSVEIEARAGSELELSYELPGGEVSGRCRYIARSGPQTWMGGDTFAFMMLRIRLVSGAVRLRRVTATEVRYPFVRAASFESDNPALNKLWNICARSLEIMSEDAYVDCADRERVEWTDCSPPAFDCTRVMMRGPDSNGTPQWADARLVRGLLRRIALTQQADGQLKAHSCSERFDIHAIMEDRTCGWVVLLRDYLESTGDASLVRELWPTLMRLMEWYTKRLTSRGLVLAREWGVWDNPLRYQVCEGAALNAMVYRAFMDAAVLAKRIRRQHDEQTLMRVAQQLGAALQQVLWNEQEGAYDAAYFGPGSQMVREFKGPLTRGHYGPTAQANLFCLYAGIVPAASKPKVERWILAHLDEVREPMSHYYLFRMLYDMGTDSSDALALSRMESHWKNQIDSEWQTTWEDLETSSGSKVHVYGMHPGFFLTAYVLGVRRVGAVEERRVLIEPSLSGLQHAKGVCVTEFGPVEVEWRMSANQELEGTCVVPERVHCVLRLRAGEHDRRVVLDGAAVSAETTRDFKLAAGRHTVLIR